MRSDISIFIFNICSYNNNNNNSLLLLYTNTFNIIQVMITLQFICILIYISQ